MKVAERRWRAMGGEAQLVLVDADDRLADFAVSRVAILEARWSRFVSSSDVCRLARSAGRPTKVSRETVLAVQCAVAGWSETAGRFDPSVGAAMVVLGYDRTFQQIPRGGGAGATTTLASAPGLAGVEIDADQQRVTVPAGVRLDFGAFGKGLAADIVAMELREAGAGGVCVSLGGDLRVTGTPPEADCWVVAVEFPGQPATEAARLAISEGGIATSSPRGRTWRRGPDELYHLLDPATGRPVDTPGAVTVIAGECWWAEVLATAACVAGEGHVDALVAALGGEFVHVRPGGETVRSPGAHAYLAS